MPLEVQTLSYTTIHETMKRLGITDTILTTDEAAQILGCVHNAGKPYTRRTLSNWLRQGLLKGARDLGSAWAIPVGALDVDRFTPPKRGRPSNGDATAQQEPSLRERLHALICDLCVWTTVAPPQPPPDLDTDAWSYAWAIATTPGCDTFSLFDMIELARELFEWAIVGGHYEPGDRANREWYDLDLLLEGLAPNR